MADSVNGQLIHLVEIMAALGRNPDNKSRWKWADFSSFRFFWFGSFNLRGPKRPAGARTGLAAAKRKAEKRTEIEKSAQQERQQSAHSPSCGNKKTASQTTTKQLAPNKKRLPSADWLHPLAAGHVTRNIFSKKKKISRRFRICLFAIAFSCYRTFNHRPKKKKMTRTAGAQCDAAPLRSAAPPSENQLETLWPRIGRRVPYFGPFKQQTRPLLSTAEQITWFVIFAAIFVVWKKEKRAVRWLFISGPPKNNSCG